jgi:hypothetical protein
MGGFDPPQQHLQSTPFDGGEATQPAELTFNVSHFLIALAISGAAEVGAAITAAAGSAEHDAVATAEAGGPWLRAGAVGPDLEQTDLIATRDAAAAGADLDQFDRR